MKKDEMHNNCAAFEEQFVEALYGELTGEAAATFEAHLAECPRCARQFEQMQATLQMMDQREREIPPEGSDADFWDRLLPRLTEPAVADAGPRHPLTRLSGKKWVYQLTAAAAILLLGVFIGRFGLNNTPPPTPAEALSQPETPERLRVRAFQHLEKSKVLLLGLVNLDDENLSEGSLDFTHYQKVSRQLIQESGYLKTALKDSRQQRLRQLLDDLEIVLLQIANLEAREDLTGIEIIRTGVERKGILFKINLEEIRRNQQPPASDGGHDPKRI